MQLLSSAFTHEGEIPSKFTCDGLNISPSLEFQDIPEGTVSLTLIMEDPDVPTNLRPDGMWDHWVVFNIPPSTTSVAENSMPIGGLAGRNTGGGNSYGGPCPPDREHRYYFKLYALDTELGVPPGALKLEVEKAMEGHILAQAILMGRYNRPGNR